MIEAAILMQYSSSLFVRKKPLVTTLCALGITYLALFAVSLSNVKWLNLGLYLLLNFAFLVTQYQVKPYVAAFHSVLIAAVMSMCELVVYNLMERYSPNFFANVEQVSNTIIFILSSKLLFFIIVCVTARLLRRQGKTEQRFDKSVFFLFLIPVTTVLMRSCLKLLFRGRDDIFLLVGMFVSVIVFLNVSVFLYRMRTENEVYGFYKNEIKTFAMEQGAGDAKMHAKKFQALLKGLTEISAGNVTCVFSVPRPDSLENQKITLILKKSEPIPFIKGNEYMNTKNGVYIGEELSVRTFRKGNVEFLKLLGTEFQVMDVLPNKMSGGVDDSLYVFWDNLEETVREKLILRITDNRILNVSLQSQKALTDAYHEYQNLAGSLGFMLNVTDARSGESVENVWYRYYNAVFLTCGLIFSLLSCLGTGYYWVKNSRRDIAIMRACGFGWRHLGACLTWKIAGMGAVAFLVASFFEAVYLILLDDMPPKAGFFLVLFWTALMVTLLVCAETGSMMVRAKKMSVDEMLRDE